MQHTCRQIFSDIGANFTVFKEGIQYPEDYFLGNVKILYIRIFPRHGKAGTMAQSGHNMKNNSGLYCLQAEIFHLVKIMHLDFLYTMFDIELYELIPE